MPFPRCYTNETLEAVALEARRLFEVPSDVTIMFVDAIVNSRDSIGFYNLRNKIIYVKKRGSILKMIETLMHEIVHAKQHKLGIISLGDGTLMFQNKRIRPGE